MRYLWFLCLVAISSIGYGQNVKVRLHITNVNISTDSIFIGYKIVNRGGNAVSVYKITKYDICYSVLRTEIIDVSNHSRHMFFPCKFSVDLNNITINDNGCIQLLPFHSYHSVMSFGKNEIGPNLEINHYYKLSIALSIEDVDIRTEVDDFYRFNLLSNEIGFRYH